MSRGRNRLSGGGGDGRRRNDITWISKFRSRWPCDPASWYLVGQDWNLVPRNCAFRAWVATLFRAIASSSRTR